MLSSVTGKVIQIKEVNMVSVEYTKETVFFSILVLKWDLIRIKINFWRCSQSYGSLMCHTVLAKVIHTAGSTM